LSYIPKAEQSTDERIERAQEIEKLDQKIEQLQQSWKLSTDPASSPSSAAFIKQSREKFDEKIRELKKKKKELEELNLSEGTKRQKEYFKKRKEKEDSEEIDSPEFGLTKGTSNPNALTQTDVKAFHQVKFIILG
jgi:SMC interacting uncharacterized protein involved in chromosome segregation